jgi:hypothetical protein
LIQRLQNTCVHGGDYIYGCVQLFFGHPRFPCVRKAPVNSWVAESHRRNGETDEHFLALGEALHCVRVAVESSKIRFLQG